MRLEVRNLTKTYGRTTVVSDVSFHIDTGEVVSLLGSNGAGKTTSFYMLIGLIVPDKGQVFLDGKEITYIPMYKRALMGIGYLPQENSVFRELSVTDNLLAAVEHLGLSKEEIRNRIESVIDEMKIDHIRSNMAYTLSGGERRRVEIARCLALNPQFIIFDEPFAGVDPVMIADIQKIIKSLAEKGFGVIINDHNVHETLHISHRLYIMHRSKIIAEGSPDQIANNDLAKRYYFGTG